MTKSGERNPAVKVRPDEAALIERLLRKLATGHAIYTSDLTDEERLKAIRAWVRFERFRVKPMTPASEARQTPAVPSKTVPTTSRDEGTQPEGFRPGAAEAISARSLA